MKLKILKKLLKSTLVLFIFAACQEKTDGVSDDIAWSDTPLGKILPKNVKNISSTPISIGAETLDRDYADYHQYKNYLDSLGAKKIRLQAGWAKTEKEKGVLNFEWLDAIINDAVDRGLEPWLQTSYGNPIYDGGGGANLAGGFPSSNEAKAAWDKWVEAMAIRYQDKVKIWEIWNESDPKSANNSATEYLELYLRTVAIIKKHVPDARFYALSLAHPYETAYTKTFLDGLQEQNKLDWVNDITFHGYVYNPSEAYEKLVPLKELVNSYGATINLHQGEQGCPSTLITSGALKNHPWTETSQAKWLLRRLIGDLGNGYQTLYFTMADLNYGDDPDVHIKNTNTKGLLKANLDNAIEYAKPSYRAMQNLCAIIDSSFTTIPNLSRTISVDSTYSVYGFNHQKTNKKIVSIWFDGEIPKDSSAIKNIDLTLENISFKDPVYVNLLNGNVYSIPSNDWNSTGDSSTFKNIPLSDYPIFISEKELIQIK